MRVTHSKTLVAPDSGTEDKVYGVDYVATDSHTLDGVAAFVDFAGPTAARTYTLPDTDATIATASDLTGYALLAGRTTGQTLTGGTAASATLTLRSTSHATKGKLLFGTSAYDEVNNRLGLGTTTPSYQFIVQSGTINETSSDVGYQAAIAGANKGLVNAGNSGQFSIMSIGSYAADMGGSISFGATYNASNSIAIQAGIRSGRDNGTSGQHGGYMVLATRAQGSVMAERVRISSAGLVGIGTASATAVLHLKAGTATANTGPFKFTTGTLLTTPEVGAMEYNNTPWFTNSDAVRRSIVLSDGTYTAGAVAVGGTVKMNINGTDYNVHVS